MNFAKINFKILTPTVKKIEQELQKKIAIKAVAKAKKSCNSC